MEQIRLWQLQKNDITEIPRQSLDLEDRLQQWIEGDITVALQDALLIGAKVKTDHGKEVDILAIDSAGDLVVIELKRGTTPREVVAQALDYAAWAATLDEPALNEILQKSGQTATLPELFESKFPDSDVDEFNERQKILIVGSHIDFVTERIVKYLSNQGVSINALTFNYYRSATGGEFLARSFLIDSTDIPTDAITKRKRERSWFKQLFESGKLKVGDEVLYQPALQQGFPQSDGRLVAILVSTGTHCLRRKSDNSGPYSFSKLRGIMVHDLKIPGIKPNWGFGLSEEWQMPDGTLLSSL